MNSNVGGVCRHPAILALAVASSIQKVGEVEKVWNINIGEYSGIASG